MMKRIEFLISVTALSILVVFLSSDRGTAQDRTSEEKKKASRFSPYVDDAGQIKLPSNYKSTWTHLGDWAVAKKEGQ